MKIKIGIGTLILPIFLILAGSDIFSLLIMASVVLVHELGHGAAAVILKKKITSLTLEPFGARIAIGGGVSYLQELIISLAGPAASFLLFGLLKILGAEGDGAEYSLLLGLVNLLPVSTLDGGRAVECTFSYIFGANAGEMAVRICGKICIFIIWLFSVYLLLRYDGGFGLFAFSLILTLTALR